MLINQMLIVIHLSPSCSFVRGALLGLVGGVPLADICALELHVLLLADP